MTEEEKIQVLVEKYTSVELDNVKKRWFEAAIREAVAIREERVENELVCPGCGCNRFRVETNPNYNECANCAIKFDDNGEEFE